MSFTVQWTPLAQQALLKLPKDVALRIKHKIDSIVSNPFRFVEHYEGEDFFKMRIGDYRALLDIDSANKQIRVEVIDKRGRIYKRR